MVSIPVLMLSADKHSPKESWGVPYDQLTEEEKPRAWIPGGSARYVGSTQKRSTAGPSWDSPARYGGREILTVGSTHDIAVCLREEMARCVIVY